MGILTWIAVGLVAGFLAKLVVRGGPGGIGSVAFRCYLEQAGLPPSGLHVLWYSAAKLRRETGASVEAVSSWLDLWGAINRSGGN